LQPYKRPAADPTSDPLWVVNTLDIIDKHRQLVTVAIANPLQHMQIGGGPVPIKRLEIRGGPVYHHREIMRWAIERIGGLPMQMQGQDVRFAALTQDPPSATSCEVISMRHHRNPEMRRCF
jgi:hypothetical protein